MTPSLSTFIIILIVLLAILSLILAIKAKRSNKAQTVKKRKGHLYDFRKPSWGHKVIFDGDPKPDHSYKVYGWLGYPYLHAGDTFLYPTQKGIGVYYVIACQNQTDPADMFFAQVGMIRSATQADYDNIKQPYTRYPDQPKEFDVSFRDL